MVLGHDVSRPLRDAKQLSRTDLNLVTNHKIEKRARSTCLQRRCRCVGTIQLELLLVNECSAPTLALKILFDPHFTLVGTDMRTDKTPCVTKALGEQEHDPLRLPYLLRSSRAGALCTVDQEPSICK
ncbi:hypothetical protein Mapa_006347 [Marchantia paleacea]|nr:hypothetical protein Mapa_006347 [Marchantia paleacea]